MGRAGGHSNALLYLPLKMENLPTSQGVPQEALRATRTPLETQFINPDAAAGVSQPPSVTSELLDSGSSHTRVLESRETGKHNVALCNQGQPQGSRRFPFLQVLCFAFLI